MGKTAITFFILLLTINLFAQEKSKDKNEDEFGIKFKGFVKTDLMLFLHSQNPFDYESY